MRAQARSLVSKGVQTLVEGTGTIQERAAKALPESGWLANDASALASLTDNEKEYLDAIRAKPSAAAVLALSDEDAVAMAHDWWMLLDSLATAS